MKATIKTKQHENTGKTFVVFEIIKNRIACLLIDGRKVDFGMSEISLHVDSSLGREIVWNFQSRDDSLIRDSGIRRIARKAAKEWGMKISECESAVHKYVWGMGDEK